MDIMIKGLFIGYGLYQLTFVCLALLLPYSLLPFAIILAITPVLILMYAVHKSDWLFLKIVGEKNG